MIEAKALGAQQNKMQINSQKLLIDWLDKHNWFEDGHIFDISPAPLVDADTGAVPSSVMFKLGVMSTGSLWAGEKRIIQLFTVEASSVSEWSASFSKTYSEDLCITDLEVDDEATKLRLGIDENIWLTCEELLIVDQPDLVVKVPPRLSDTHVSIEVRGEPKPTPLQWIERFADFGVHVAWRRLGDVAVPATEVPEDDYSGWFLQETGNIEGTQYGLMVSCAPVTANSFRASFQWWHESEGTQARIWPTLAKIAIGFKESEVQCGNCKLTGIQWEQAVRKGQSYIETIFPDVRVAHREPVRRSCLLCNSSFEITSNANDFFSGYYCAPCMANHPDLFTERKPQVGTPRRDFEATIRFLSALEGGRQANYVPQHLYRPNFSYKDNLEAAFMIWPTFLTDTGIELEKGTMVDTSKPVNAYMTIISDKLRKIEHQKKLSPGVEFFLRDGNQIVANGIVLRILDLYSE